jgi:p38 MAP kinase
MWRPDQRISVVGAHSHSYLSLYCNPTDEPEADAPFSWALVDSDHSLETWKYIILVYTILYFLLELT